MRNTSEELNRARALAVFTRQMSTLVDVGINLMCTLRILEHDAPAPYNLAARDVQKPIMNGRTLCDAIGVIPDLFSPFYVKTIRWGEIGGVLEESLRCLADMLEETLKIASLTGKTVEWAWPLYPSERPAPQDWSELDEAQRKLILMMFCRSLGLMMSAGVPDKLALETSADLLPAPQRESVRSIADRMVGRGFSEPLAELEFVPVILKELLRVFEGAESFPDVLEKASHMYRRQLECEFA